MHYIPNPTAEKVAALYRAGFSLEESARLTGHAVPWVAARLRDQGVQPRPVSPETSAFYGQCRSDRESAVGRYVLGVPARELANNLAIEEWIVRLWVRLDRGPRAVRTREQEHSAVRAFYGKEAARFTAHKGVGE